MACEEKDVKQMFMIEVHEDRYADERLSAVLVNTGQRMIVGSGDVPPWLNQAVGQVLTGRTGGLCSAVGDCSLRVTNITGGALLRLSNQQGGVGMALTAWQAGLDDFIWGEVLRVRGAVLTDSVVAKRDALSLSKPPLPWVAVVLWPGFLRAADTKQAFQAEQILWAAARVAPSQHR